MFVIMNVAKNEDTANINMMESSIFLIRLFFRTNLFLILASPLYTQAL
jgi:hypothetical protein